MQDLEEKFENYRVRMKNELRRKQMAALPKEVQEANKKVNVKITN